jgi:hypothetical protein
LFDCSTLPTDLGRANGITTSLPLQSLERGFCGAPVLELASPGWMVHSINGVYAVAHSQCASLNDIRKTETQVLTSLELVLARKRVS